MVYKVSLSVLQVSQDGSEIVLTSIRLPGYRSEQDAFSLYDFLLKYGDQVQRGELPHVS